METIERALMKYEETVNKMRIPAAQGLIGGSAYWKDTPFKEIIGINNANGTELAELEIPAGHVFVCSLIQYASNEGRSIAVCTVADAQVLGHASQSERFIFGDENIGIHALKSEDQPIFVVDNSAGAVAIDMLVYAPHTVLNATNDPVTSYFQGHLGGILYDGAVETRGV